MTESRLLRSKEKQSKKTFFFAMAGSAIVIFVLIFSVIPFLIKFSLSLEKPLSPTQQSANQSFISAPVLDPLPQATSSSIMKISGSASPNETIALFVNNDLQDKTTTRDSGNFSFDTVTLSDGQNSIKTQAIKTGTVKSNFSDPQTIDYHKNPPSLTIDSPSDNQTFTAGNSTIPVSGKTDQDATVTINGFWAIMGDSGTYSYQLHLQNGDNQMKVVAVDNAGNKTEIDRKVTYNP